MRARAVATPVTTAAVVLLAGAFGPACKTYSRDQGGVPAGWDALSYEAAPGRVVVDDGGLVGGGGTGGGGGGGAGGGQGPSYDGGSEPSPRDASPDRASPGLDAGPPDLSQTEAGDTCELLMPACGPGFGCYPAAGGQGRCMRPEPGTPAGTQCFDPVNCAPGLTCVNMNCVALCALAQATCPGGGRCVPYAAYAGVGYCLP